MTILFLNNEIISTFITSDSVQYVCAVKQYILLLSLKMNVEVVRFPSENYEAEKRNSIMDSNLTKDTKTRS